MAARVRRDIEVLVVWALREQGLGWVGKERSRDDFSDLGTVIDTGSHPTIGLWSDDDAMLVKLAIEALPPEAAALIVQYCRAGLRPDWCEDGYGSYQQLRSGHGLLWNWSDQANRTGTRTPRMGFVGEQRETVDFMRAQYGLWWQGLADIVRPLNQKLERHEALPPAVAAKPWEHKAPVVFGPDGEPLVGGRPEPKVSVASVEELRDLAADPIRARATDWDFPKR